MLNEAFVSVIIPAYNEVRSIAVTIRDIVDYFSSRNYQFEIIVSVDGGNDGTYELVARLAQNDQRIKVLGNKQCHGKGFAIRCAVPCARGEIIGFVDADNKTPITEYDKVPQCFSQGYDIVIGSRAIDRTLIERPQVWYRRWGAVGFGLCMHLVVGLWHIPDTQCGFKFFRKDVALQLFNQQKIDGYIFDVEILYLAEIAGHRLIQIPVRWRDDRDSRLAIIRGNIRNLYDLLRIPFIHRHCEINE